MAKRNKPAGPMKPHGLSPIPRPPAKSSGYPASSGITPITSTKKALENAKDQIKQLEEDRKNQDFLIDMQEKKIDALEKELEKLRQTQGQKVKDIDEVYVKKLRVVMETMKKMYPPKPTPWTNPTPTDPWIGDPYKQEPWITFTPNNTNSKLDTEEPYYQSQQGYFGTMNVI